MNHRIQHIRLLLIVAVVASALTGCNNRKGVFGSDNWGRNGYANYFLNNGINPNSMSDGRVIGYVVYNQSQFSTQGAVPFNNQAGGVRPMNNQNGPNSGAGGIAGGVQGPQSGTPCLLKIASSSTMNAYAAGSNQNFGGQYHETLYPTSGTPYYAIGAKDPITCGKDTQIAGTASAFYVTSGANGNNVWVKKFNQLGVPMGFSPDLTVASPTKVSASSSGHIAVLSNYDARLKGSRTMAILYEGRVDQNGSWVADLYHEIPAPNGSVFTDMSFDREYGAIYAGIKYASGAGEILVLPIADAMNGNYFNSMGNRGMYNFAHNLPSETAVNYLFRTAMPVSIKTNAGLAGVLTANLAGMVGKPFFMEADVGLSADETVGKSHEELNDIYQNNRGLTVQHINVFDPFQVSQQNSPVSQPGFAFKDFAIGNNIAYLITEQGVLYTMGISFDNPFDPSNPLTTRLNVGRANFIESSEDKKTFVVGGSAGLQIGRLAGSNVIFSSNGRADIPESSEIVHAAILEKVVKEAAQQPVAKTSADNKKKDDGQANANTNNNGISGLLN